MEKEKSEILAEARKKIRWTTWLSKNIPFCLYISFLAVVYIFKGHYTETTIKNINKLNIEIKDLQYEYKTISSELMFQNKHSEVVKRVASMGLKEFPYPPMRLKKTGNQEK
jgi:Bacteriodetes cell division protein (FtsL-like)